MLILFSNRDALSRILLVEKSGKMVHGCGVDDSRTDRKTTGRVVFGRVSKKTVSSGLRTFYLWTSEQQPQRDQIPVPETWTYYLVWRKDLCGYDYVTDFKMR